MIVVARSSGSRSESRTRSRRLAGESCLSRRLRRSVSSTTNCLLLFLACLGLKGIAPLTAQPHRFFECRIVGEGSGNLLPPPVLLPARCTQFGLQPGHLGFENRES